MMRTVRGKLLTFLIPVFVLFCISSFSAATVIKTVNTPSDGCVLVAVRGSFTAESAAAIKEVNRIRYEACTEGVQDPRDPERRLTPEDYVPVKWSSALEYIARVRAAEASLVVSHTRPNGNICFTVSAPDGTSS